MSIFDKFEKEFDAQITNYTKWPVYPPSSDPHFHNGYELYFLFSGSTKYIIENNTYEIEEGDIVWIPPYIDHKTQPNNTERHKRLLFWIIPHYLEDCLKDNKELSDFYHHYRVIRTTTRDVKLFRKFSNLLLEEYFTEEAAMSGEVIKGLLLSLLVHLKRMYERNTRDSKGNQSGSEDNTSYSLNLLISYINTHYAEDITLASLAEQVNMNPVYISSLFKKNFGFTFKEYLLKLRITKATQLLKSSSSTVEAIAFECGFRSSNHFCKTFKRLVGMSPLMFRNIDNE